MVQVACFLEKENNYYIIDKKYFNEATNSFTPVTIEDVVRELTDTTLTQRADLNLLSLNKPFVIGATTYVPSDIINFSEYKLRALSTANLSSINVKYTPTDKALLKTNIKVKEQYMITPEMIGYKLNLNIETTDKTKIDYFIDYGQTKSYKSSSILNTDIISDSFYANFKLNEKDASLTKVYLNSNLSHYKIKEYDMDVYDDFKNAYYIVFNDDYPEITVSRVIQEELIDYKETLDNF